MQPFSRLVERLSSRHWPVLVVAMLLCLHGAATAGTTDMWARGLMVAHFGLFMLWQPFLRAQQQLRVAQAVVIALVALALVVFFDWAVLGLWVALLAAVIGGKVFLFRARWQRLFHLATFFYLATLFLVWIVPNGFGMGMVEPALATLVRYGLFGVLLAMLAMPAEVDTAEPQIVDLFYATLLFLLLVALALGSFAFMVAGHVDYVTALVYTLLTIAAVLIVLSLAWNPRAGVSGLPMLFSRYLLSIGLPFEQWLRFLAALSRAESDPEQFLRGAVNDFARLPWVVGGEWETPVDRGAFGVPSKFPADYRCAEFSVRLYARVRPSAALMWHFNLLGQLLAQFYVAKLRERALHDQVYMEALHQTGARVTHDVKNLLQSLNVLCTAAGRDADAAALGALMRRHLPVIVQRLQSTIEKLQRPETDSTQLVRADAWWAQLQAQRHADDQLVFEGEVAAPDVLLPKALFDSAADNLVQNALEKRRLDARVRVQVRFKCSATQVRLSVTDSGAPIPKNVLPRLLEGPVRSASGYGVGLYQLARQAHAAGFTLRVASNVPGAVCFEVRGAPRPPAVAG